MKIFWTILFALIIVLTGAFIAAAAWNYEAPKFWAEAPNLQWYDAFLVAMIVGYFFSCVKLSK